MGQVKFSSRHSSGELRGDLSEEGDWRPGSSRMRPWRISLTSKHVASAIFKPQLVKHKYQVFGSWVVYSKQGEACGCGGAFVIAPEL